MIRTLDLEALEQVSGGYVDYGPNMRSDDQGNMFTYDRGSGWTQQQTNPTLQTFDDGSQLWQNDNGSWGSRDGADWGGGLNNPNGGGGGFGGSEGFGGGGNGDYE